MFLTRKLFSNVFIKSSTVVKKNYCVQISSRVKNNLTFHRQTLNYFRNQPRYNKFVLRPTTIVNTDKLNYNCISSEAIPTDELLVKFLYPCIKPSHVEIDAELEKRVSDMTIDQMLTLMDACLSEKNQVSKNSRSFKKCMQIMDGYWFRRPDLTAAQTLQLIYYVSTYKSLSKHIVEYGLQKLMNDIGFLKQLNNEELSILAVAAYKSNAKVYDKMLRIFAHRVETNIDKLIQYPMYLVSLIKPLRRAKYHDPILLTRLIAALNTDKNNKVLNDTTSSIHFLTYLADANCGNIEFLQKLVDSIGNIMVKDELKHYRIKDVSNYVFSASYAGLSPKNPDVCKIITNFIDQIFDTEEKCQKRSKMLISMCLSMWMLNYKPIKLMQFLFSHVPVAKLRMPNAHKQDNRLNLLLTCALIEQPDLISRHQLVDETSNSMPDPNKHLCERPFLVKVFQTLQKLSHKLCISNIEYNFNIPNLRILGIKVIKNNSKIVHIEVLDSCTCLYDTGIPNGMMKLKFRLQSKLNYKVITVSHKVPNHQTPLECNLETLLSKI